MKKLTIIIPALIFALSINAQVNFNNNTVTGSNASALGENNTSSGTNSFVSGYNSVSSGYASFANGKDCDATGRYSTALGLNADANGFWSASIGSHSTASGTGSIAIGNQVDALFPYSIVIGEGSSNYHLVNNISSSFMVGFHSDIPTFFVGSSSGQGTFGKVGIGTTEPIATLDVNGDLNFKGRLLHNGQEFTNSPWTEGLGSIYYTGGNVGIGTKEPVAKLDVNGNQKISGDLIINGKIGIGTTPEQPLDVTGDIYTGGGSEKYDGNSEVILIRARSDNWYIGVQNETSAGATDFFIGLSNKKEDGIFHIKNNGNIGIGTTNPTAKLDVNGDLNFTGNLLQNGQVFEQSKWEEYSNNIFTNNNVCLGSTTPHELTTGGTAKLTVNGGMVAKEIEVTVQNWKDYVFYDDYKLMPLYKVEKFIKENFHLPEVPSEADVIENGVNLGNMDAILLQKIEELTLYTIEQQKMIDALKEEVENIKNNN